VSEDPEVLAEAERSHRETHAPGFVGPCYGPTVSDLRQAARIVAARRHETGVASSLGHRHGCVTRGCKRRYNCRQNCPPDSRNEAPCPKCWQEILDKEPER
jgi:hypothetical protein